MGLHGKACSTFFSFENVDLPPLVVSFDWRSVFVWRFVLLRFVPWVLLSTGWISFFWSFYFSELLSAIRLVLCDEFLACVWDLVWFASSVDFVCCGCGWSSQICGACGLCENCGPDLLDRRSGSKNIANVFAGSVPKSCCCSCAYRYMPLVFVWLLGVSYSPFSLCTSFRSLSPRLFHRFPLGSVLF